MAICSKNLNNDHNFKIGYVSVLLGICFKKTTRDLRERKDCSPKGIHYSTGYNCKDIEMTVPCRALHSHVGIILFILLDRGSEADLLHKFWKTMLFPNSVNP